MAPHELFIDLDRAAAEHLFRQEHNKPQFSFRTPHGINTVNIMESIYVEVMCHVSYFHLTSLTIRDSELRVAFAVSMAELSERDHFWRPHRSYLVNQGHIFSLTSSSIQMDNGSIIHLARQCAAELKKAVWIT